MDGPVARHRSSGTPAQEGHSKSSPTAAADQPLQSISQQAFSPYLYTTALIRAKFTTMSPKLSQADHTSRVFDSALWLLIVCVMMFATSSSYSASLAGGTMSEVKKMVVTIATDLLKSILYFLAGFFLVVAWPLPAWRAPFQWMPIVARTVLLSLMLIRCAVMLRQDQGSTFDHHGEYNMLAFGLIVGPALIIGFVLMLTARWLGSVALAVRRLGALVAILSLAGAAASIWAVHNWGYGLFGRGLDSDEQLAAASTGGAAAWAAAVAALRLSHMPHDAPFLASSCRIQRPGSSVPWVSMLPQGTLNFLFDASCTRQRAAVQWRGAALVMACPAAAPGTTPPSDEDDAAWAGLPWYEPRVAVFADRPGSAVPGDVAYMMPSGAAKRKVYMGPVQNLKADFVKGRCPGDATDSLAWRVLPRPDLEGGVHLPMPPPSRKQPAAVAAAVTKSKQSMHVYEPMSVLVLLLDAVSREQFNRRLAKTKAWLEAVHGGGVSVFDFQRMHAVGFNTGPNTGALFRGQRSSADAMSNFLAKSDAGPWNASFRITPTTAAERAKAGKRLIWSLAQASGAVTSMAQGMCQSWTGTYPHAPGTGLHFDAFAPFCDRQAHPYPHPFSNLDGPFSIVQRCLRGRNAHTWLFDWLGEVQSRYAARHRWTAGLFMEGHEGTGEVIHSMDGDLTAFLQGMTGCVDSPLRPDGGLRGGRSRPKLCQGGALNNTLVFLMADHGGHMGPYSVGSLTGNLENQLPLFTVLAPEAWLKSRPQAAAALAENQFRLLSSYDVYDGWKSLLGLPEFHNASVVRDYGAYYAASQQRATAQRMHGVVGVPADKWGEQVPGVYDTDAVVPPADIAEVTQGGEGSLAGIFKQQSAERSCADVQVTDSQCSCSKFPTVSL